MDIHLIRHPKTVAAEGTCYGSLDIEAAPDALEEAATRLAPQIPADARIISSPMRRALALAERLGSVEATDARLVELDFGAWENRLWSDIPREEFDAWSCNIADHAPPGGESVAAMSARVREWWNTLEFGGAPLVVVSHGGPIRAIVAHLLDAPIANSFRLEIAWGARALLRHTKNGHQLLEWNIK